MHLTFIDSVFAIIIIFFAVMACFHGFLKEIFGKIAIIAGAFVAFFYCGTLAFYIEKTIKNQPVCIVLAFILLFIATFLIVKIIQIILSGIFSGDIFGSLDRVLGFVLGVIEGLIIVCCILILVKAQPWFNLAAVTDNSWFWSVLSPVLEYPIQKVGGILV